MLIKKHRIVFSSSPLVIRFLPPQTDSFHLTWPFFTIFRNLLIKQVFSASGPLCKRTLLLLATHPLREPEYWIGVDTRGWSHGITFTVQTHFSEDSWIIHFCHLHLVPYPNTYTLTRLQSLWTCAAAVSSLEATGTAGSLWRPSAAPHCIAAGSAPGWGGASEPAPRETRNTQTPPVQTNPPKNQTRTGTKTRKTLHNVP